MLPNQERRPGQGAAPETHSIRTTTAGGIAEAGRQIRQDGKGRCIANIRWRNRDLTDRFLAAVVALVRQVHPGALDSDDQ
jgi:hypothetical protein